MRGPLAYLFRLGVVLGEKKRIQNEKRINKVTKAPLNACLKGFFSWGITDYFNTHGHNFLTN
jgi:hypothetical protein